MKYDELPYHYRRAAKYEWERCKKRTGLDSTLIHNNILHAFGWHGTKHPNFWASVYNAQSVKGLPPLPYDYRHLKGKVTYDNY